MMVDCGRVCIGCRAGLPVYEFRQSEIQDLHKAIIPYRYVLRLDVPMNNPSVMCCSEGACELDGDTQRVVQGRPSAAEDLSQSLAFDEFRDNEPAVLKRANVEHCYNVRMIQRRGCPRLHLKPPDPFRIMQHGWR